MRKLNSGLFNRLKDPCIYAWYYRWGRPKKKTKAGIIDLIQWNVRNIVKPKSKECYQKSYNRKTSFSDKRIYSKKKSRSRR